MSLPPELGALVESARTVERRPRLEGPVSVLYGGAHLFRAGSFEKLGALARATFADVVRDESDVCAIVGEGALPHAAAIRRRVEKKLAEAPLEDVRVDFEDGYGLRSDDEEDADATRVGAVLASRPAAAPRWMGVRVRAFERATAERAARTLVRVARELDRASLPERFVVTLPKVRGPEDVARFTRLLLWIERDRGLREGSLGLELMIELPSALVARGGLALGALLDAGEGRVTSVHLGAYDLLSACDVAASFQSLAHPLCDLARGLMVLGAEGRVRVADGATTRLPLPVHRGALDPGQVEENRVAIRDALRAHATNVTAGLSTGIHQGWDLHPAQLVGRYLALAAHYEANLHRSAERLAAFVDQAARARASGQTFDDAATAEGLLAFFAQGLASTLLSEADLAPTGLSPSDVTTLDFARLVAKYGARG